MIDFTCVEKIQNLGTALGPQCYRYSKWLCGSYSTV